MQRKLASHEFSTRSLREFTVNTLQQEVDNRLIPLLDQAVRNGNVLDLQDVLKRFAFDVVCKVSLGTDPFCLDLTRPVPGIVQAFDSASEISAKRGMAPVFLIWKIKRFFNIGSEKKLNDAIELVHESVMEIIRERKRTMEMKTDLKSDGDLLSRLLLAGHDEEVVRDMAISFIMAGRDTTSSAMTWLFWLLCNNREFEKKIVKEVDSVTKFDYESLKDMNYIKACLCESMRLYPPVAWDSKHAINDDVLPDGTKVSKGDRVTYFPYGMGRMEALWGENRLEFNPGRWIDETGSGKSGYVSPFKFPVFQAGPRVCLGKEMAFIQMKYVVGSVLKRFEFEPVSKDEAVFVPLLTGHMVGGLRVVVRKRT